MARIRTFIAVELPPPIRSRIIALQNELARTAAEVKWVEPENLHVTLLFLGEVADRDVSRVCTIVSETVAQSAAFAMSVETVGCFPNLRRPRTVWVGVGQGTQELCSIHDDLERPLMELGYRREERKFTPHITLGRVKNDRPLDKLAAALARNAAWKAGETTVGQLHIMGSELTPTGPVYTVLGRAPLLS